MKLQPLDANVEHHQLQKEVKQFMTQFANINAMKTRSVMQDIHKCGLPWKFKRTVIGLSNYKCWGDGKFSHQHQALLDLFLIYGQTAKKINIVGNVRNSEIPDLGLNTCYT